MQPAPEISGASRLLIWRSGAERLISLRPAQAFPLPEDTSGAEFLGFTCWRITVYVKHCTDYEISHFLVTHGQISVEKLQCKKVHLTLLCNTVKEK